MASGGEKIKLKQDSSLSLPQIFELGFGTGHCISAIAKAVGDSGKVYGIDILDGMLRITSQRLAKNALSGRVELTCSDPAGLPHPDPSLLWN